MGKIRLYELAQRLGADSKTLIERFARLGVEVKSHMSMLEEKDVQKIRPGLAASEGEHYDEKRVSQGIIRRRRKDPAPTETVPAEDAAPGKTVAAEKSGESFAENASSPSVATVPPEKAETSSPELPKPPVKIEPSNVSEASPEVIKTEPPAPAPEVVTAAAEIVPEARETAPEIKEPAPEPRETIPEAKETAPEKETALKEEVGPEAKTSDAGAQEIKTDVPPAPEPQALSETVAREPVSVEPAPKAVAPAAPVVVPAAIPAASASKSANVTSPSSEKPVAKERDRNASRPQRRSSGTAKILGRVDLGLTVEKAAAPAASKPEVKTASPVSHSPVTPVAPNRMVSEMPVASFEGEPSRRSSGKGSDSHGNGGDPEQKKSSGKALRGDRKKSKIRLVDIDSDMDDDDMLPHGRREMFEPKRADRGNKRRNAKQPPKKTEVTVPKAIKRIIRISDVITVGELAKRMSIKASELIRELMKQGTMVTINDPLDYETAMLLASDFNYEVENVAFDEESVLGEHAAEATAASDEQLQPRPPVVTIMGHVDHGKTSLLDAIRETNVIAREAGGITQHIGAYEIDLNGRKICFLDTPGHEAFTSMRARGAKVTDIVVLVVAADDGVMPQTEEAINHSKAAGVPIIVAINKIDKPAANPEKVRQELTKFGLLSEDWGGDTIFVEVSAKKRINLSGLLEMILLQAEMMELKADPSRRAKGTIIEARLDRGRGPVATVLIQEGTLRPGNPVVAGVHYGHVRAMMDDCGRSLTEAGPSTPVEITGLSGVPEAGETFYALEDERAAKEVALHRQQKNRAIEMAKTSKISLEQLYSRLKEGDVKELNVIVKADVQGSVEAVCDSLTKLSTSNCRLTIIHSAVGGITETDVTLASASNAIIIGFNVRPEAKATVLADTEGVDIRLYDVIYDAVNDVRDAMQGLLAPTYREKALGKAEIRQIYHISKVGTVAGCAVIEGKIVRNAQVRLLRDNVVIWSGKIASLKRLKDDAKEVLNGYECGIALDGYNDIKPEDILEAFEMEEVKTRLA
ncbi:MAG: translation initiation factor IF-2 [Deltaproteobacteria bacterium]|nr:translation initiation factor IF-2 [Deltaproteobacteria bacterium]